MVEIETERLSLRRWREEDLGAYARVCADPEVMRYIGGGATLSRDVVWYAIDRREWSSKPEARCLKPEA